MRLSTPRRLGLVYMSAISLLYILFSAFTLILRPQEGHQADVDPVPLSSEVLLSIVVKEHVRRTN